VVEFEFWWLLGFPLFFGLGWVAARIDIKQIVSESRALPRSYFKGLNFLLNEQPDKAIEAFIEVVKVDPETIELHFALGSLFRRRGEYDRAIRMHQNLLERADLGAEQKVIALAELGQDYLKAGILDRAEEVFGRLTDGPQAIQARRHLLQIFEQEKDWPRAIEMTKQVESDPRDLAQYFCELAASEAAQSRPDAARRHLEAALEANRKCVRASLQLGDLERSSNNLERYPSLDLLDTVFQQTLEVKGAEEAYTLVRDELRRNPTLLGLDRLLEAQIIAASSPERRRDLELVRNLVHGHTRRLARYRCENCGFKARQFHWHCPACGGWETYPPRRTEEFDLAP